MTTGELLLPDYGRNTLAEVLPALAHHLAPTLGSADVLGIPASRRYLVVMVDGLGWHLLARGLPLAGYFAELFGDAVRLTSAVPATTATSLSCLVTGAPPGQHGIVGYSFRSQPGRVLNALSWEDGPDPESTHPLPTWFERLAAAGIKVTSVVPSHFPESGLTTATMRGGQYATVEDESYLDARVELAVAASRRGESSLVYFYERRLDHTGHTLGVASDEWARTLTRIDALVERLRQQLDPDVCLLITGDHGMIDVPKSRQLIIEDHRQLSRGVDLVAGEGRLRQLYCADPVITAARWAGFLGDRAWVYTADQAIAAGWFGPVLDRVRPRIGDVLVAMRGDWAVMTRSLPKELNLVGMHASLTSAEMSVPLLVDAGWGSGG